MLLRVSSKLTGTDANLMALTKGSEGEGGVPAEAALISFTEAALCSSPNLAAARERVLAELGNDALVDAAAVVGNFQRMVRIADGTGIPLDDMVAVITADMREELELNQFGSASNTRPVNPLKKWFVKLLEPLILRKFRTKVVAAEPSRSQNQP